MYTASQVAQKVNITSQSVRNYSGTYAEFLSPGASGEDGTRLYTDEDVEVLRTVAGLRKTRMPHAEITERLRSQQAPPIIEGVATTLNEATETQKQPLNEALDPLAIPSSILARFEAVERRLDTQDKHAIYQAERRGATLALVAVGFLLLLAWLLVNGR
jgi:DNA-binding transcriptional MerR regulator